MSSRTTAPCWSCSTASTCKRLFPKAAPAGTPAGAFFLRGNWLLLYAQQLPVDRQILVFENVEDDLDAAARLFPVCRHSIDGDLGYLPGRFIGVLDWNGHTLTGMQYPLFGDLQYALVKDLAIAGPSYDSGARAMLAVRSRQTVLGDISVSGLAAEDQARQLPLVGTKTDFYGEYGRIAVTAEEAVVSDPAAAEEAEA